MYNTKKGKTKLNLHTILFYCAQIYDWKEKIFIDKQDKFTMKHSYTVTIIFLWNLCHEKKKLTHGFWRIWCSWKGRWAFYFFETLMIFTLMNVRYLGNKFYKWPRHSAWQLNQSLRDSDLEVRACFRLNGNYQMGMNCFKRQTQLQNKV